MASLGSFPDFGRSLRGARALRGRICMDALENKGNYEANSSKRLALLKFHNHLKSLFFRVSPTAHSDKNNFVFWMTASVFWPCGFSPSGKVIFVMLWSWARGINKQGIMIRTSNRSNCTAEKRRGELQSCSLSLCTVPSAQVPTLWTEFMQDWAS